MRDAFSRALVAAAKADDRVVLLTGDHGYALFDGFREACPDQYINAGVAEQNMVGVAAGLARAGYRPVVYGLAAFVPIRVLEQIKLDCCYTPLPVVFLGDGAGVVYSTLGSSHQCTEDIAATRALANLTVLSPADAWEMEQLMPRAISADGPVYLRMGKADLGAVHTRTQPHVTIGSVHRVDGGNETRNRIALLATGSMVSTALAAAERLEEGTASVWSVPSIKPIDERHITQIARDHDRLVTLEEHNVYGGLGSLIAEIVSDREPRPVHRIGIPDAYSLTAGSWAHLMRTHGLDAASVTDRLEQILHAAPDSLTSALT